MTQARYSDGQTAKVQMVEAHVRDNHLVIAQPGGEVLARWPVADIRRMQTSGAGGDATLGLEGEDARLVVGQSGLLDLLAVMSPQLKRGLVARRPLRPVLLAAVGAVIALPLIFFVLVPRLAETLAVFITPETEQAMGDRTYPQLANIGALTNDGQIARCTAPAGLAALDDLIARMERPLDLPVPLQVEVWDHPLVNALALPGGRIILFRGLLDQADGENGRDGVAGILAHEIGHVANRDGVRLSLRAAGSAGILSLVLGDFAGGAVVLVMAEALTSASYTREAEANADAFALDQLAELDIAAEGFAAFFEEMAEQMPGEDESLASHLASHPALQGRADNARALSEGTGQAMDDAQWSALRAICAESELIVVNDPMIERMQDLMDRFDPEQE